MSMQTTPKKRSKAKLAVLILLSLGGWAAAIGTGMTLGASKTQATKDHQEILTWKVKAAKAYTELEMLKADQPRALPAVGLGQDCITSESDQYVKCGDYVFKLPPTTY